MTEKKQKNAHTIAKQENKGVGHHTERPQAVEKDTG